MRPARGALICISIFMASITAISSPSCTLAPSATFQVVRVPAEAAVTAFSSTASSRGAGAAPGADRPDSKEAGRPSITRRPSSSMATRCRPPVAAGWGRVSGWASHWGISWVSIQRVCTPKCSPLMKSACAMTASWNGSTVGTPSILNSLSARRARCTATSRLGPQTISLASIESNWPATCEPDSTPLSTRTPGPDGASKRVTRPGAGKKPRPTSSALMRNSKAWPWGAGTEVSASTSPSATRNCRRTRSVPVVSSVTGCSTCKRVFTSRNEIAPLWLSRYSTVPAPT